MKILRKLAAACLSLGVIALGLGSCSKDKQEADMPSIRIVKVEFPSSSKGGEGMIALSEGGFEVSTSDAWVQATKSGEREVRLTLERNRSIDSRVANVLIKKGEQILSVPITQLGTVSRLPALPNHIIKNKGGYFAIDLSHVEGEVAIRYEAPAEWLTYTVEEGQYIFAVAEQPADSPLRSVVVNIKIGLLERSFTVRQKDFIVPGVYRLSYTDDKGKAKTAELSLYGTNRENIFLVYGSVLPFYAQLDPETNTLVFIMGAQLPPPASAQQDDAYFIFAVNNAMSNVEGDQGYHFVGVWDGNLERPKFTFTPQSADYPRIIFILRRGGRLHIQSAGENIPNLMSNMTIEWLRPLPSSPGTNP